MRASATCLLLACLLFVPLSARADSVAVSLTTRVPTGQQPSLEVRIDEPIAGFRVELTRGDGKQFDIKGGGRPGVSRTIWLEHLGEGVMKWHGTLTVNRMNGEQGTMPLDFETEVQGRLKLTIDKDTDVDFERRTVFFKLNHPAAKVHLKVLLDDGQIALDDDIAFNGEPAGTRLSVTWPPTKAQVMIVDLRAFDRAGFYDAVELTKWQVDIPHEEVNFDSGKWDVRPSERAKLDASYRLIAEAVTKFGSLASLRLFIAGHTDTKGSNESNRVLSHNRARALGAYLRAKGLRLPVLVEGFGEEALLVATPDETDELKNRRAEYIIAIDTPTPARSPFVPSWKKL
jgi:outer membrane protein OmpA-like peptidoglycan-associated protein